MENHKKGTTAVKEELFSKEGSENPYLLHQEMGEMMLLHCTAYRQNDHLRKVIESLKELRKRYQNIALNDHGRFANQTYLFTHRLRSQIELALVIAKGALLREEDSKIGKSKRLS